MATQKFVKQIKETERRTSPVTAVMPLLLILAVALSAAYLVVGYQLASSRDLSLATAQPQPVQTTAQLEKSYQAKLALRLSDYLQTARVADEQFLAKTQQLKEQLLALLVPPQYREKHLALVLSLEKIETESRKGNWLAVTQEMEKISQER